MPKAAKKRRKPKKKSFYRRFDRLATRGTVVFILLIIAAFFIEIVLLRDYQNPLHLRTAPTAVLVIEDKVTRPLKQCFYNYQPLTLVENFKTDSRLDDGHINIVAAEKVDAEYLAQALYSEDEPADISYRIVSMVENEVSTVIKPHDGFWDNLKHLSKKDLAEHKSYELYEEELPETAVKDEFSDPLLHEKGYFIYRRHKDIKDVNINLSRKPYYFGAEPVIAVVIDDMGINQRRTADITKLHAPLTSSFLTYGRRLDTQVDKAINSGHEIMIHVPMEPKRKINIAPDTLTTEMNEEQIKQGLEGMIKKFKQVRGINNHMGSQFTEDKERMNYVMQVLRNNHLFFLDSKTSAQSVGRGVAGDNRVPYAHRHVFLDNDNNVEYVSKQLQMAENIARRNGYAVAIGHPKSATYQALQEWLPTLKEKHIKLVPMSQIVEVLNPLIVVSSKDNEQISE